MHWSSTYRFASSRGAIGTFGIGFANAALYGKTDRRIHSFQYAAERATIIFLGVVSKIVYSIGFQLVGTSFTPDWRW